MKRDLTFHAQKMRYQNNGLSYGLIMLSMVLSLMAMFTLITYDSFGNTSDSVRVIPDLRIALEIGITILTLLVSFLAAEKVKCYDPIWSFFVVFALAIINFWRMDAFPVYVFVEKNWVPYEVALRAMIEFGAAGGLLVIAGLVATIKVIIIRKYGKETRN